MFRRKDKTTTETVRKEPFTYIHRGTTLIGQLIGEGRVRVHGNVKGDIKVAGVLEVSQAGVVDGELIEADEVKILGRVRADVIAGGKVEIWNGGELIGNVKAASLDIEEGAFFTGTSEMVTPDGKPRLKLGREPFAELEADHDRAEDELRILEPSSSAGAAGHVEDEAAGAGDELRGPDADRRGDTKEDGADPARNRGEALVMDGAKGGVANSDER